MVQKALLSSMVPKALLAYGLEGVVSTMVPKSLLGFMVRKAFLSYVVQGGLLVSVIQGETNQYYSWRRADQLLPNRVGSVSYVLPKKLEISLPTYNIRLK